MYNNSNNNNNKKKYQRKTIKQKQKYLKNLDEKRDIPRLGFVSCRFRFVKTPPLAPRYLS